jgi:hypothetical protein
MLIGVGLFCAFVLLRVFGRVPTLTAVVSGGLPLAATGFCLLWWNHWRAGRRDRAWRTLCLAGLLPVLTLTLGGFLSYGVTALLMIAGFVAAHYQPRRTVLVGGLCFVFLGLSLYPTYIRLRNDIRGAVWGGQGIEERADKISGLITEWEWFDSENKSHLAAIEARLNQNALVGRAVRRTSDGIVDYARGETLVNSFVALVPRVFWPEKPHWAGSGGLVTRFTGIRFARGTSVGIGHVMELYVNFGTPGVFVGYIVIGLLLGVVDLTAGRHLAAGEWQDFAFWYVPGLALLQVGGNFAEATAAAVGSLILCLIATRVLFHSAPERKPAVRPDGRPAPPPAKSLQRC